MVVMVSSGSVQDRPVWICLLTHADVVFGIGSKLHDGTLDFD